MSIIGKVLIVIGTIAVLILVNNLKYYLKEDFRKARKKKKDRTTQNGIPDIAKPESNTMNSNLDKEEHLIDETKKDHESVDLALPSGLLWATCNIGANAPEEHGVYFQWGRAEMPKVLKPNYTQLNIPYCFDGRFTKYNTNAQMGIVDNQMVLDPADDVASVNWSECWHTPTREEYIELIENCTWEWKQKNGVNGYWVTSKKNGNSLFFPTTGLSMAKFIKDAETTGCYWTSSLHKDEPVGAWGLDFSEKLQGMDMLYRIPRFIGLAIRPVRAKSV